MSAAPDDLDLVSGTSPAELEAEAARVARRIDRAAVASVVGEIEAAVAPRPLRDAAPSERQEGGVFALPADPAPSNGEPLPKVVAPTGDVAAEPLGPQPTLEIQRPLQAGNRHDTTRQLRVPKQLATGADADGGAPTVPTRRYWPLAVLVLASAAAAVALALALALALRPWQTAATPPTASSPSAPSSSYVSPSPTAPPSSPSSSALLPSASSASPEPPSLSGSAPQPLLTASSPSPKPTAPATPYGDFHGNE